MCKATCWADQGPPQSCRLLMFSSYHHHHHEYFSIEPSSQSSTATASGLLPCPANSQAEPGSQLHDLIQNNAFYRTSSVPSKQHSTLSHIALESISEHVTTTIFWGSAPTPTGNSFIKQPPLSNPGYAPWRCCFSSHCSALAPFLWQACYMHWLDIMLLI